MQCEDDICVFRNCRFSQLERKWVYFFWREGVVWSFAYFSFYENARLKRIMSYSGISPLPAMKEDFIVINKYLLFHVVHDFWRYTYFLSCWTFYEKKNSSIFDHHLSVCKKLQHFQELPTPILCGIYNITF